MATTSAGLLLYRYRNGLIEVLLVHPGGPFFRRRDEGAWSIPKGECSADETGFPAALREFEEELGYRRHNHRSLRWQRAASWRQDWPRVGRAGGLRR